MLVCCAASVNGSRYCAALLRRTPETLRVKQRSGACFCSSCGIVPQLLQACRKLWIRCISGGVRANTVNSQPPNVRRTVPSSDGGQCEYASTASSFWMGSCHCPWDKEQRRAEKRTSSAACGQAICIELRVRQRQHCWACACS